MALLEIEALAVAYGKAAVLEGLTLYVEAGEIVALIGPNGAGKTTLLKAISRALPARGGLRFNDHDLHRLRPDQVAAAGIGHCPEGRRLFPDLTVRKNLQLGAFLERDAGRVRRRLEAIHAMFPVLAERGSQIARTLSGGEQQMLAIGRALMGAPKLLLLDEPTVGLAHKIKVEIAAAIGRIREDGVSILIVEQDAAFALEIADRAYVLERGTVAKEGPAAALQDDPAIRRAYFGIEEVE